MKDLGEAKKVLGMKIELDRRSGYFPLKNLVGGKTYKKRSRSEITSISLKRKLQVDLPEISGKMYR